MLFERIWEQNKKEKDECSSDDNKFGCPQIDAFDVKYILLIMLIRWDVQFSIWICSKFAVKLSFITFDCRTPLHLVQLLGG